MAFDLDDEEYEATRKLYKGGDTNVGSIQVGEYIRTLDGYIDKVEGVTNRTIICNNSYLYKKDITKHSKNIIDILEKDDFIIYKTGIYSMQQKGFITEGLYRENPNKIKLRVNSNYISTENVIILAVVTHEQFNSIMYEVEEENGFKRSKRNN